MFEWLNQPRAVRDLKTLQRIAAWRERYLTVRTFLNRGISILIIPTDDSGRSVGFAIRIKTLLIALSLIAATLIGASSVIGHTKLLQASLADAKAQVVAETNKYDALQSDITTYLRDVQEYTAQSDAALEQVVSATPGDLVSFHSIDFEEAKLLMSQNVEVASRLNEYFKAARAFLYNIPSLWPVKNGGGIITNPYGPGPNPFTGRLYVHTGIDITTFRAGEPIVATANGVVTYVGYASDLGNHVVIEHAYGFSTVYGHFVSVAVHTGQRVERGQVIGFMGNTGLSTGPHVHYEIHVKGTLIDPTTYLAVGRTSTVAGDVRTNYGIAIGGTYGSTTGTDSARSPEPTR